MRGDEKKSRGRRRRERRGRRVGSVEEVCLLSVAVSSHSNWPVAVKLVVSCPEDNKTSCECKEKKRTDLLRAEASPV